MGEADDEFMLHDEFEDDASPFGEDGEELPPCPYCGKPTEIVDSIKIYRTSYGMVWICTNWPFCNSYVGCHKDTNRPKGTIADHELRELRKECHALFDPQWLNTVDRKTARRRCYQSLSDRLNLRSDQTHFGMFDVDTCKRAIAILGKPLLRMKHLKHKGGRH